MTLRNRIVVMTLVLGLVGPGRLHAFQLHTLRGIVARDTDGAVVPGATVTLAESLSVVTDEDGAFRFDHVPRGTHRLTVSAPGFATAGFTFGTDASTPAELDLGLVPIRPLAAVDVRLTGNVTDSASRTPIANAEIFVAGDPAAVTDSIGAFLADMLLVPGTHLVLVRAVGYRLIGYELSVGGPGVVTVDVALSETPVSLAGIEVVERSGVRSLEGFLQRMESEIGQFLTPADVEQLRSGVLTTSEMLARVPGIMVRPSRFGRVVSLARCGRPELFLDGKPVEAADIDDIIPVEHIAAVEVYSDPGRIPAQFNRMQPRRGATNYGACGAILFWTIIGHRDAA